MYAVLANSITPVPDFEVATTFEIVFWGISLSLAFALGGLTVYRTLSRGSIRMIEFGLGFGCFVVLWVSMIIATRTVFRAANERSANLKADRELIENSNLGRQLMTEKGIFVCPDEGSMDGWRYWKINESSLETAKTLAKIRVKNRQIQKRIYDQNGTVVWVDAD
jgi:hypothetical protein